MKKAKSLYQAWIDKDWRAYKVAERRLLAAIKRINENNGSIKNGK